MYVIQVTGSDAIAGINKTATNTVILPADRCTWTDAGYIAADNQYAISNVNFYPGNAGSVSVTGSNTDVQLGYIGKSGRFVGISDRR